MKIKPKGYGTLAIHAGNFDKETYGALNTPIYQSSTFYFDSCEHAGQCFTGAKEGFVYTRFGNPTTSVLENKIAALEGAEAALAVSSGMGAITTCLWTIASAGKHIVADQALYGCTYSFLSTGLTRFGVEVSFVDLSDIKELKAALRPNTCCVYMETPANPNLKITDIEEVCKIAHGYNPEIVTVIDNTFATSVLQRPLELGCDVSVYSATKYFNGHGDVIAGFICGKKEFIDKARNVGLKDLTGAVIDPFCSYLILRGLKTYELRVERHCKNAQKVAEFLEKHPKVEKVYYPGLKSHKGHDVAAKQMHGGFGGVLAFEVKGGIEAGKKLCNSLKMIYCAVSLGDAESLIEHPASMTHSMYTPEERAEVGISEGLIRLSVGLENVQDIIADLRQALNKVKL